VLNLLISAKELKMTKDLEVPFYSQKLINVIESTPKGSPEWTEALNGVSEHIKILENFIKSLKELPFELISDNFKFILNKSKSKSIKIQLKDGESSKPIIQLPVNQRILVYKDFPQLAKLLEAYQGSNDEKSENTDKGKLLSILKESLIRSKDQFKELGNSETVLRKLKELKLSAPTGQESLTNKLKWFKDLSKILLSLKFVEPAIKAIKDEIPKVWNQLTFKQKLQVASIAPIVGAGTFIGGIGVAGLGNAVGLPGILVVVVLLFLTNGLIDFLDFIIKLIANPDNISPEYENIKKSFENVLSMGMKELFKTDFDVQEFEEAQNFKETGDKPRDYEYFTVNKISKEYNGKGFVTSQSRDGGIDGYIICNDSKEIILVQSKYYSKKVGFGETTQYLGTLLYWQKEFASKFEFPITKMIIVGPNDFSIEAKRVSDAFNSELVLKTLKY
jgi:hypothetical protein